MMQFLYTVLFYLIQPLIWLRLLLRSRKAPAYRKRWLERYGFCQGKVKAGGILLHSVSVGETIAAIPLVHYLKTHYPHLPITITTMTPTGSERVKAAFGDSINHVYLPYDLPCAMRRFFTHIQPKLVVIMETELWPNMISQLDKEGIPLIIANARLSERSANGYKKLGSLTTSLMKKITCVAAQNQEDGNRFISLGLPSDHLVITGSIKFDITVSDELKKESALLKQQWAENRPVWIAASTHEGEEDILLATHKQLLQIIPELLLILVPRHPERFSSVIQLTEDEKLSYITRSSGETPTDTTQVIIGDTMGELMLLYGVSDIAFVGGSLIERGGHNPLEPAAHALPILMGPHVFNFKDICRRLENEGGLIIVKTPEELTETLKHVLIHQDDRIKTGQSALAVLQKNQGALKRLTQLINRYLV